MPVFFFHHYSPQATMRDDIGCSFASLELAYLDAHRSMVEIGAELIKQHEDCSKYRIEIADGDGQMLMELHFSEVFSGRRGPSFYDPKNALELRKQLARTLQLRRDFQDVCAMARASVSKARDVLQRARSIA